MNKKYFIIGALIIFCTTFFHSHDAVARGGSTDLGSAYTTHRTCRWETVSNKVTCYKSSASPAHQIFSGTSCPSGWTYHGPVEKNSCSNEVLCDNQNRQDYTEYKCHYITHVDSWGACSNGVQYATSVRWSYKNGQTCNNIALNRLCGACGASDGGVFSAKPSTNLCNVGTASGVTGSGPWYWTCTKNGVSDNCLATKKAVVGEGKCGTRHRSYSWQTTSYPVGSLWCASGSLPLNSLKGDYFPKQGDTTTWTCTGNNGGSIVSCAAKRQNMPICTGGNPPNGATWCSGDTTGLTANTAWLPVNNCTNTRKCEYTIPPCACGSATQEIPFAQLGWNVGTVFCANGALIGGEPGFPEQGKSVPWDCGDAVTSRCVGDAVPCAVTRGAPPPCACNPSAIGTVSESEPQNACTLGTPQFKNTGAQWSWTCEEDSAICTPSAPTSGSCEADCVEIEIDAPASMYLKHNGNKLSVQVRVKNHSKALDGGLCDITAGGKTETGVVLDDGSTQEVHFEDYISDGKGIDVKCTLEVNCSGGGSYIQKEFTTSQNVQTMCMEKTCNAQGACQATPQSATSLGDCSSTCNSNADCSSGRMIETRP